MNNSITSMKMLRALMLCSYDMREAIDHGDRSVTREQYKLLTQIERERSAEEQMYSDELKRMNTERLIF